MKDHTGRWILVIDDDLEITAMLEEVLTQAAYRVVRAHSVSEAAIKLQMQVFDGIVLDLRLGQGDGVQVIEFIRKERSLNRKTPIQVISGFLDVAILRNLGHRVEDVLVKPFRPKEFLERLSGVVDAAVDGRAKGLELKVKAAQSLNGKE